MSKYWNIAVLNALQNARRRKNWRKLRRFKNLIGATIELQIYNSEDKSNYIRGIIKSVSWRAGKPESFQLRQQKLFHGGRRGPFKWTKTNLVPFKLLFDPKQIGIPWISFEDSHFVFSTRIVTEYGRCGMRVYIYPSTKKNKVPKRPNF